MNEDAERGTRMRNEERGSGTRNEDPERGTRIWNEERGSGTRNEDPERGTRIRNEERGSGTRTRHVCTRTNSDGRERTPRADRGEQGQLPGRHGIRGVDPGR